MTNGDHTHSINTILPNYGSHYHQNNWHPADYQFNAAPIYYNPNVPQGTAYGMGGSIYANPRDIDKFLHNKFLNDVLEQPTPRKQPAMSTIDKIKQERREKREREELEAKFESWDAAIGSAAEGDIYAFSADMSGKTYRYAVIYVDKRWFLTGAQVVGFQTEDFIAWLIEREVQLQDFIFCEPLS